MRNPEATKMAILSTSAQLFNIQGYKATSISDITKKLGMTKGAIYRHFDSKSDLEKEALIYLTKGMLFKLGAAIRSAPDVKSKMYAIFDYFSSYAVKSPEEGGCPILNAGVEADDTNPELKIVVAQIIEMIHDNILKVLHNGVKHKQLDNAMDIKHFTTLVFTSLEGAILMVKVCEDSSYMDIVIKHLKVQFDSYLI